VSKLWHTLLELGANLGQLFVELLQLGGTYALLLFFLAWCLWGVNWQKTWPVLARGGWAPLVLLSFLGALTWSRLAPSDCDCLVLLTVPNFWWHLGAVGLVVGVGLFCGWLQGVLGYMPPDVALEPAAAGHGHGHDDHGSHDAHSSHDEHGGHDAHGGHH